LTQWNFDFFCPPGGVGQGLGDVLRFQVRIVAENFVSRTTGGYETDDGAYRHPHTADARLAPHDPGIPCDTCQLWHVARDAFIVCERAIDWKSHVGRGAWVERRDESFYVAGSRVPLATIVREFRHGQSPEAIRSSFPTLTLEQVYGAITFYLGHKDEVNRDVAARERVEDVFSETHSAPVELKEKLRTRRRPR